MSSLMWLAAHQHLLESHYRKYGVALSMTPKFNPSKHHHAVLFQVVPRSDKAHCSTSCFKGLFMILITLLFASHNNASVDIESVGGIYLSNLEL